MNYIPADKLIVPLYKLKKGDKFRYADWSTDSPIYVKGRPHTDTWLIPHKQMYLTTLYAPGECNDGIFTGYADCNTKVIKIEL